MTTLAAPVTGTKITRRLAEYATRLRFADLPAATVDKTKQAVLDLVGIAIRASTEDESTPVVRKVADAMGGAGNATAIGIGARYQPHYAAFLNGTFAHTLDFDDTHEGGSIHPGAPVIPAALAMAEEAHVSGRQLIAAIVAGYDGTVRISEAADPAAHYDRGFHPTATAGVFGATAAVAHVMGADADVLENAFGINGSQSAGSLQFLENGAWNKRIHVGFTAHNAIFAYRLAAAGALGAREPLEGRSGFLHGYTDGADPERITRTLGERFAIDETAFKPYPSCRYSHAPIELLCELARDLHLTPQNVESVRIGLPRKGMDLIGIPEAAKRTPVSIVDGQFSMHFLAAVALLHGRFTWDDYQCLGDDAVAAMIERVEVFLDPEIEALFPTMAASVEVRFGGQSVRKVNLMPKGEPGKPLSWDEVIAKFDSLTSAVYTAEHREAIVSTVRRLDALENAAALTKLLGAPGR